MIVERDDIKTVVRVDVDSFASESWRKVLRDKRRPGEAVAAASGGVRVLLPGGQLRSGDIAVAGSDSYANLHAQLMSWDECAPLVEQFCAQAGISAEASELVAFYKRRLAGTAARVDAGYPSNTDLVQWVNSTGRRNTLTVEVLMGRPAGWMKALTGRSPMNSPGAPSLRREMEREFWREIATGLSSEDAALGIGVSQAAGGRWFLERGGMPVFMAAAVSDRYLSFQERDEIAVLKAKDGEVREIAACWAAILTTISRDYAGVGGDQASADRQHGELFP